MYYTGTEDEWNSISIGSRNTELTDAVKHYVYAVDIYDSSNSQKKQVYFDRSDSVSDGTVILALYDGSRILDVQTSAFDDNTPSFTTDKAYTTAKVMVWNGIADMQPVCKYEVIEY